MFPLRDNIPSARYPVMTVLLIVVNGAVFFWEMSQGRRIDEVFLHLGIVPIRYTSLEVASYFHPVAQVVPFLTSMFLHGGWLHVIGNMWTLWIFGDNVEDRLGHGRYLLLYLASGLTAGLLHILTNAHSQMPTIGASGAVAGVMGAYFRFFPHARVLTIIPPFFFTPFVVPAVLFLGFWFLLQFFNGTLSLAASGREFGGVAWWAHVGGFGFGLVTSSLWGRRRRRSGEYNGIG